MSNRRNFRKLTVIEQEKRAARLERALRKIDATYTVLAESELLARQNLRKLQLQSRQLSGKISVGETLELGNVTRLAINTRQRMNKAAGVAREQASPYWAGLNNEGKANSLFRPYGSTRKAQKES